MTPTTKWMRAHLRMLESLPKRTHTSRTDPDINWRHWRKRRQGKQAVMINGVQYDSLTLAAKALDTNRQAVQKMVERGEAEFA